MLSGLEKPAYQSSLSFSYPLWHGCFRSHGFAIV